MTDSSDTVRVLCLDIEGGYGGSSRSLFKSIEAMDRSTVDLSVWCKRDGPIRSRYSELGVDVRITPAMPKITALKRFSRNAWGIMTFAWDWVASRRFRADLANEIRRGIDVVHLNHESLFWLARWLKKNTRAMVSMHIRTILPDNGLARFQERTIQRYADHTLFITENERERFEHLTGRPARGDVIYNIATPPSTSHAHAEIPADGRFKVASLSNFDPLRGVDRLADIAMEIAETGRRDILFVLAGNMAIPRSMPGELSSYGQRGLTFERYVEDKGLSDLFLFLGHTNVPEQVLAGCDCLIKMTREANPWGRDILEAMAAEKPVISLGRYMRFVEDDVTGFLLEDYEPRSIATKIMQLADDPATAQRLGRAAADRVAVLCDPKARAGDLAAAWHRIASA